MVDPARWAGCFVIDPLACTPSVARRLMMEKRMRTHETNWAGNYTYTAAELAHPRSVEELQRIVAMNARVRALGSRHSFSDLADTSGTLICLLDMPVEIDIDAGVPSVRVSAGATYGQLASALNSAGWALGSMASLPHITVAGAVATGTHGSGDGVGSLASAVRALELVGADGQHRTVALRRSRLRGPRRLPRRTRDRHPPHSGRRACLRRTPGRAPRARVAATCTTTSTRSSPAPTASASSPTGSTPRPPRCG